MRLHTCLVLGFMGLAACSEDAASGELAGGIGDGEVLGGGGSGAGGVEGSASLGAPTEGASGDRDASSMTTGSGQGSVEPGTLTAGVWDDNRNFDRFLKYRAGVEQAAVSGRPPFSESEHRAAYQAMDKDPGARATLDIVLVIDTTGSMGDEMRYLQTEFTAMSEQIEARFPESQQRWALVLYRDQGDSYVTRWFDFREQTEDFRARLAEQSADGGGDFPEAPDQALRVMNQLAWRTGDDTARLAFWVADAPHHDENAATLANAVRDARKVGIHIYPVASSGVDELTEVTMRSSAQLTQGRYVFLTDDSGVGGAHKEPSIPCYFVTQLDHAILRMVDIEMSGVYREPTGENVIRTSGEPTDGACTPADGQAQLVY